MSSYPIWHKVQACHYKSNKSYGGRTDSGETIYVGTSAKYSEEHCKILTTKREIEHEKYGKCLIFKTSMDNVVLKTSIFSLDEKKIVEVIVNYIQNDKR